MLQKEPKVLVPEQEPLLPGSTGGTNCMSCPFRNNVAQGIAQSYQELVQEKLHCHRYWLCYASDARFCPIEPSSQLPQENQIKQAQLSPKAAISSLLISSFCACVCLVETAAKCSLVLQLPLLRKTY